MASGIGYEVSKRAVDVAVAAGGLLILSPLFLVIAIAVRFSLGSPVIFVQQRPGMHGRLFPLYKYRTMKKADPPGGLITDEQRLTRLGRFLRSTSLDELPSLLNVLRGELSLVGPRPLLPEYLDLYSPEQARRHEVRPGITGHAQVNGRNAISWEKKFQLDVEYVDRRCAWLDVTILVKTVTLVLHRRGVSEPGHATVTKFKGNDG